MKRHVSKLVSTTLGVGVAAVDGLMANGKGVRPDDVQQPNSPTQAQPAPHS